jgi:hypothetical protein
MLGTEEVHGSRLSPRTSATQKIVLALFSKGQPISWFVVTRSYDTVLVFIEHQFPDGKWVITGGKVVNDLESWMRQRSIGFDVGVNRARISKPKHPEF